MHVIVRYFLEIVQKWIRYPTCISFLRLRSYRIGGFTAGGDWSIGFDAHEANIKCYAVISGACWLAVEDAGDPIRLHEGHCFLLPHGRPFRVASDLSLRPEDWRPHFHGSREGALIKLNDGEEVTVLGSHFELGQPQAAVLIGMMPPIVHLHSDTDRETLCWAFDRMRLELTGRRPGSILIAQQLASMIFVQVLRLYLDASRDVGWLMRCPTDMWEPRSPRCTASPRGAGRWRRWPTRSACRDPASRRGSASWSGRDRSNI